MLIAQFVVMDPEDAEYSMRLEADEIGRHEVGLTYSISRNGEQIARPELKFDLQYGVLQMTGLEVNAVGYLACLITCGLGQAAQAVLECWRAGHRTPGQLLSCLQSKRVSITPSLLNCAIGCLGGVIVGT